MPSRVCGPAPSAAGSRPLAMPDGRWRPPAFTPQRRHLASSGQASVLAFLDHPRFVLSSSTVRHLSTVRRPRLRPFVRASKSNVVRADAIGGRYRHPPREMAGGAAPRSLLSLSKSRVSLKPVRADRAHLGTFATEHGRRRRSAVRTLSEYNPHHWEELAR